MSVQPFRRVQDELLKRVGDNILNAEVLLVLPRIGGYNAKPYDLNLKMWEPPRPSEVKALWRWWLRTIYSACRCGENDYKDLDNKASHLLGNTKAGSKFSVTIEDTTALSKSPLDRGRLRNIPRLRLLTMLGKESAKTRETLEETLYKESLYIYEGVRARIGLYKSGDKIEDRDLKFAAASFLLSLILGGLGSATGRGLGSIVVENVSYNLARYNFLRDVADKVNNIINASSADKLNKSIYEFIDYVISLACDGTVKCESKEFLPKVPTLVPEHFFKLESVECSRLDRLRIAIIIGEACLKSSWEGIVRGVAPSASISRSKLHTWILGLPRSAKGQGYFVGKEPGRRPSAIKLKYLENGKGDRKFIIIYGFLSKDWPLDRLIYESPSVKSKYVKDLSVLNEQGQSANFSLENVFATAFNFVKRRVEKECTQPQGGMRKWA